VCGRDRFIVGLVAIWTEKVIKNHVGAHPDRSVNSVHGDRVAVFDERLPPSDCVQIGSVDEGSVDVDQDCLDGHASSNLTPFGPNRGSDRDLGP
jgi:hypothetical protein